jgi:hypothetical protein
VGFICILCVTKYNLIAADNLVCTWITVLLQIVPFDYVRARVHVGACVCVCVHVREREGERELLHILPVISDYMQHILAFCENSKMFRISSTRSRCSDEIITAIFSWISQALSFSAAALVGGKSAVRSGHLFCYFLQIRWWSRPWNWCGHCGK